MKTTRPKGQPPPRLPNLIIIGAMKCGTTSLKRIFAFLGLPALRLSPQIRYRLNSSAFKRRLTARGRRLGRSALIGGLQRLPAELHGPLEKLLLLPFTRRLAAPRVPDRLYRRLAELLKPEADRLRRITGQPFAGWRV